jgi:hypothetical protein
MRRRARRPGNEYLFIRHHPPVFRLERRKRLDKVTTFVEKLLIIRGDACQEMRRHLAIDIPGHTHPARKRPSLNRFCCI